MATPKTDELADAIGKYVTWRIRNYHRVQFGIGWSAEDEEALVKCEKRMQKAIANIAGETVE